MEDRIEVREGDRRARRDGQQARRELAIALLDRPLLRRALLPFAAGRFQGDDAQRESGRSRRAFDRHRPDQGTVLRCPLLLFRTARRVLGLRWRVLRHRLQRRGDSLGRAGAEQRIERGQRTGGRQPLRRAVKLLRIRALAAHARLDGNLEQIRRVGLACLSQLVGLRGRLLRQRLVVGGRLGRRRIDDLLRQRAERRRAARPSPSSRRGTCRGPRPGLRPAR